MFLFILESLGTSELILIGIVALIFLGPRKLPAMAKKAGKIMAEFRGTANEFRETWQREVNFEEEAKMLDIKGLDEEESKPKVESAATPRMADLSVPEVRQVDASQFTDLIDAGKADVFTPAADPSQHDDVRNDKKNWL